MVVSFKSFSHSILQFPKTSASGIFGVITVAKGISSSISALTLSGFNNGLPLVATITVSSTIFLGLYSFNFSAITLISSLSETIPIFTASGKISLNIQSSCFPNISGVESITPYTPVVFCAVREVMALIAYIPWAVIVLISACIPAPPLQSLPAIVRTLYIFITPYYKNKFS